MQTFLPYKSFEKSAKALDRQRLGKQRVEAYQILRILAGEQKSKAWKNHPAVTMWRGYQSALALYAWEMCKEWKARGYKDTLQEKVVKYVDHDHLRNGWCPNPKWLGSRKFHASHRSNLLRKMPKHYSKLGWKTPDNLPYVWPTNK